MRVPAAHGALTTLAMSALQIVLTLQKYQGLLAIGNVIRSQAMVLTNYFQLKYMIV